MITPLSFRKHYFLSILCLVALLICGMSPVKAQQAFLAAGGDAAGTGGSASYSVGQVAYMYNSGSNGSQTQGVQQEQGGPVLPNLNYAAGTKVLTFGTAITPITPIAANVTAPAYGTARVSVAGGFGYPSGAAVDTAGNVYVADRTNNVVKKIDVNGVSTDVDRAVIEPYDVAIDGAGNLYVADYNNQLIKKIPAGGGAAVTVDAGVAATTLAADVSGNVYFLGNNNKLYKLPANGSGRVTLDESVPEYAYGLAADNFGNVYMSSIGTKTLYKYPAGGGARQAIATSATLIVGVKTDAAGDIYFNEPAPGYGTYLVKKVSANDYSVTTVLSGLPETFRITFDSKGNLYLLETYPDMKVEKIAPSGGYYAGYLPAGLKLNSATGEISGTPTAQSNAATDYYITAYNSFGAGSAKVNIQVPDPSPAISYNTPNSFVVNEAITPLTPTVTNTVTAPAYGTARVSVAGGFGYPSGAAVDTAGNVYVADRTNNVVKKIDVNGVSTDVDRAVIEPYDVAIDGAGNLYVADYNNQLIKKIPVGGGAAVTVNSGVSPTTIAADVSGNIYFLGNNNKLYKLPANGSGRVTLDESVPEYAYGLAADNFGNVYMSSIGTKTLYKYPAGGGARQAIATSATLIVGVKTDAAGDIYFNEPAPGYGTYLVKKVSANDYSVTTVLSGLPETFRITFDGKGNLYLLETYPDMKVEKIAPSGGYYAGYLPAGLKLNSATGEISGTPTAQSNAADYNITAYNPYSKGSAKVNIRTYFPPQLAIVATAAINNINHNSATVGDTILNNGYSTITEHGLVYSLSPNPTTADRKLVIAGGEEGNYVGALEKLVPGRTYYVKAYAINEAGTAYGNELTFTTDQQLPVALDKLGLDSSATAAGAYSLRLLSADYAGPLARISINNSSFYDIYPDSTSAGAFSLNSYISAPLSSYNATETGATDNKLSSVLPGNTAKVAIWYNQSGGQGNNAIQRNDYLRPEIAVSGILDTLNNTATMTFNGSQWLVVTSTEFNRDLSGSVVYKASTSNTQANSPSAWYLMNGMFGSEQPNDVNDFAYGVLGGKFTAGFGQQDNSLASTNAVNDNTRRISSWTRQSNTGALNLYNNGANEGSAVFNSGERTSVPSVAIGAVTVNGGGNFFGNISELALFPAVYGSGQRELIESSQAQYYGIALTTPNTSLANLVVSDGTLTPAFNKDSLNYQDTVGADVDHINITATAADTGATIIIAGEEVSSGSSSSAIDLYPGDNEIEVVVNGADNITTTTYRVNVYRAPLQPVIDYGGHTFTFKAGEQNGITPTSENVEDVGYYDRGSVIGQRYTNPRGIAVDGHGNIFVADDASKNIYQISTTGDTTVYASGLPSPTAVAADGKGNLYVANTNGSVQKVSTGGSVSNIATGLGQLKGIAVSRAGNVYVTDYTNNKVLRIPESGAPVEIGSGLVHPKGIAIDSLGFIYVINGGSNSLKLIFQDSSLLDYSALTAPSAVAANASGAAYIVDEGKINTFLTIMGAAQPFNNPTENIEAVASDSAGNVYATSTTTGRAYKFKPLGGYFISPALPEGMFFDSYSGSIIAFLAKPTPAKQYVVTAYNNGLLARDTLTIGVEASADLYDVVLSAGTLSPCFCSGDLNYTASVDNDVDTLRITPIPIDPTATIKINGIPTSYTTGLLDTLNIGDNIYSIVVTSQDSSVTKTYTITINRAAISTDARAKFKMNPYSTLTTVASRGVISSTASVSAGVSSVTVTPTAVDSHSVIKMNGTIVPSGTAYGPITLNDGPTVITTLVTAQDGVTTKSYKLTINRNGSTDSYAKIKLSPDVKLTTTISGDTVYSTASVAFTMNSISVIPTSNEAHATIKVNGTTVASGTPSLPIALATGPNTITTVVTSENGSVSKVYVVTVTRRPSNNALAKLKLTPTAVLYTTTSNGVISSTASVASSTNSVKVTAFTEEAAATVTVNGILLAGKESDDIPLNVGTTSIVVVVTAPDGTTTKTYNLMVTRGGSNNAALKLKLSPASPLTTTTSGGVITSAATVNNTISSITVIPTAQDPNATITVQGVSVVSGEPSSPIALTTGENYITVIGTAQDGVTTKTYNLVITRQPETFAFAKGNEPKGIQKPVKELKSDLTDNVVVHPAVSPNGDGSNDFLVIEGLSDHPGSRLAIMNTTGTLVFETKDYGKDGANLFDGHSKTGVQLKPGTYYYQLEYKVGNEDKRKTGFIILKY